MAAAAATRTSSSISIREGNSDPEETTRTAAAASRAAVTPASASATTAVAAAYSAIMCCPSEETLPSVYTPPSNEGLQRHPRKGKERKIEKNNDREDGIRERQGDTETETGGQAAQREMKSERQTKRDT